MNDHFSLGAPQWAMLRRLLDQALDLPAGERATFVDSLDGDLAEYRLRLRALLANASDGTAARLLDTLPKVETAQFAPLPGAGSPAETPKNIGPYRLLRELGSGGMASVWLAERTDMLHGRQVALKLPHGAWRRAGLVERMVREREILATLEHPHIARLYDAGVGDDGQPYLALEYVQGEPLDRWCERQALDVPARLELFGQVVRAVAHAHAQLVVHRDLKPSNILVTAQGQAKLLDFGIAKLLEQGQAAETALTQQAGRALTPDYAAPEQILGKPIGTAADIYALGVVLFELLAGQRPYTLKRESRGALEEAILHAEVPRPSSVAPAARRKALRGDLDTIVLKALKKEHEQRYATADAFADDIERHLAQRPVLAQPDTWIYRAGKLVARNRLATAATGAVAAAVVLGAAVAVWQAGVARAEQQRAELVLVFITSIFRDADPTVGTQDKPSASELLARARLRIDDQFAALSPIRIELLCVLAESFLGLEDYQPARDAAQSALDDATRLLGAQHTQALRARSVLAQVHRGRGETAAMRTQLERILPALRADPKRDRRRFAAALIDWAELELDEGRYESVETTAREVLQLVDGAPGQWESERAAAWRAISGGLEARMDYRRATEAAERGYRHALAAHPQQPRHPQIVSLRHVYARLLAVGDQFREALAMMQQSIDDTSALHGPQSQIVGQYLQALAVNQARAGDLDAARHNGERALSIIERHYGHEGAHTGAALDGLAFIHLNSRRPALAIPLYDRALAIVVRHYGAQAEHSYPIRMRRAASLAYQGQLNAARLALDQVADEYSRVGKGAMTRIWHQMGVAERLAGRLPEALALQQRALASVREGPQATRERLPLMAEIGIVQTAMGHHDDAISSLEPVLRTWDRVLLKHTPMRSDAALALGRARLAGGDAASALVLVEQADAFWRGFEPSSRWAGEAAYWLARCHAALGRSSDARVAYARAVQGLANSPFSGDATLVTEARRGS